MTHASVHCWLLLFTVQSLCDMCSCALYSLFKRTSAGWWNCFLLPFNSLVWSFTMQIWSILQSILKQPCHHEPWKMCARCCQPYRFISWRRLFIHRARNCCYWGTKNVAAAADRPVRARHVDQQQIRHYLTSKKSKHSDEVKKKCICNSLTSSDMDLNSL